MKKNKIKRVVVIDFDGTLINTIGPEDGKPIWKEKTGKDYPHKGWWSKRETLDIDVFDNQYFEDIKGVYDNAKFEDNTFISLCTGRITPLKKEVEAILNKHEFEFDEVVLNGDKRFVVKGRNNDTLTFKLRYFDSLINEFPNIQEFEIFDDRNEHHEEFVKWGEKQKVPVIVNHVKR